MLKTYLLPSLGLSRSFSQVLAFVYNRTSGCGGACQRSTCNGARIRKHFSARKIAVSQFSSVRPPGTKAAISPKWNGLSAQNFERARLKDKQRGIRRNLEKYFCRLIPLFGVDSHICAHSIFIHTQIISCQKEMDGVMNEFLFWFRHPLVLLFFHEVTSQHPFHVREMIFPLVPHIFQFWPKPQ